MVSKARRAVTLTVCGLVAFSVAACGGTADDAAEPASSTTAGGDPQIAAMLPAEIRDAGEIKVGTAADSPPLESIADDGKTIVGVDPDLGAALGDVLGVPLVFVNSGFDGLLPGLAGGKHDIVMAGMNDTAERQQVVDFVDYLSAGTNILVNESNDSISEVADLCGQQVGVLKGTTFAEFVENESTKCQAGGAAPITVNQFNTGNEATLALSANRVTAVVGFAPVNANISNQTDGSFKTVGPNYDAKNIGIAVPKGQDQLRDALKAAMEKLMSDGTYQQILDKYSLNDCCSRQEVTINDDQAQQ
ncbi:MAG: ABC transporter substrate-binding protein [Mycobacterium sp.]